MTVAERARARAGPRRSRGQATVELALVLPLLVLLVLAVIQVGLLVRARVMVTHAAREAAREAAVGASQTSVFEAAARSSSFDRSRLGVDVTVGGDRVEVVVTYRARTDVALVGPLLGDVLFEAAATMRLER